MNFTENGDPYYVGPLSDIFSLGIVLLECCSGYSAPRGGDPKYSDLRKALIHLGDKYYPCSYSCELIDLVNRMIEIEPKDRPTAEDIMNHRLAIASAQCMC